MGSSVRPENSERITSSIAQVGGWVEAGLTEGLGDNTASGAAANAKGENAVNEVGKGAETASPSKATRRTGQDIDRGLVAGMEDMAPAVKQKAAAVGRQAVEAFKAELSKGGAGNLKARYMAAHCTVQAERQSPPERERRWVQSERLRGDRRLGR